MANRNQFNRTNPFANPNKARRSSLAKLPPKPPSQPPNAPPNGVNDHIRRQLSQYQNMYKQTKNQLEVLKSQYRGIAKELSTYKAQKTAIDTNHSNIVLWQRKISNLELEKQTLMDKNGLFLQQKNTYLLQLANEQEQFNELKAESDAQKIQIENLENELLLSTQNYTQQLSKKDNKYKNLKTEYSSLNEEYIVIKRKNTALNAELQSINTNHKEITQEMVLIKDKYNKLETVHNKLVSDRTDLQQQISQEKDNSSIAVRLASKKDKNVIKDLRQTLKSETMKAQQFRAEYLQLKDEINDLRDWRENYLRQQLQAQNGTDNEHKSCDNTQMISDNVSSTSSQSNHTSSSRNSRNSRNSITIKNKFKIIKHKSVKALQNEFRELPSLHNLLSNELGAVASAVDEEKTKEEQTNMRGNVQSEHDEFIMVLSNKLAALKENYINLKQDCTGKNAEIEQLNGELSKKKEWIADLIEKLNDKPLPPTPVQLEQRERVRVHRVISDEDRVLENLESQGLCPDMMGGYTTPKRVPPSVPPPRVVVSPSYNKGMGHAHGLGRDSDVKEMEMKPLVGNELLNDLDELGDGI